MSQTHRPQQNSMSSATGRTPRGSFQNCIYSWRDWLQWQRVIDLLPVQLGPDGHKNKLVSRCWIQHAKLYNILYVCQGWQVYCWSR